MDHPPGRLLILSFFVAALAGCGQASRPTSLPSAETASGPPASTPPAPSVETTLAPGPSPSPTQPPAEIRTTLPALEIEVVYDSELNLSGYLCKPEGDGPFPSVVYNHGGLGTTIGGAPLETCRALAAANMVGFAPIRRETIPLEGHLDDVMAAVELAKGLEYVDPERLGMIGFSRGGLLTFIAASERSDFHAVVIMASALAKGQDIENAAREITAPLLLLVSSNDLPAQLNNQENVVEGMREMEHVLSAAGKDVQLIVYPPYEPHGHMMFFEVGAYWDDVSEFLSRHLGGK